MRFVVTGGRGFIGSHFVEEALNRGHTVIDIDKMTYASHESLPWDDNTSYTLVKKDICDLDHLPPCDVLVNFAAESHVDNSINSSEIFMKSNTEGVHRLLELLRGKVYERPLFIQISTDEVYGDITSGQFTEESLLNPSNPYSASKAAAEMFVLSYHRTYGINYLITRSSNNYGQRQYIEKLIPNSIECLKENRRIPIHGDGMYVRDWLYVKDNVEGIFALIDSGIRNEVFNISGDNEMTNLAVVENISKWFGLENFKDHIRFVPNRLGQDIRYSLSSGKLKKIGWSPRKTEGLYRFLDNE